MRSMVIIMEEAKLQTLAQIRAFLEGTSEVAFRVPKEDRNPFIERILKRFGVGENSVGLQGCSVLRELLTFIDDGLSCSHQLMK